MALIATIGSDAVKDSGFVYVIFPCLLSTAMLLGVALVFNNLSTLPNRNYPVYWRFWNASSGATKAGVTEAELQETSRQAHPVADDVEVLAEGGTIYPPRVPLYTLSNV
jgi:CBS-domain-containing membrane protein